MCHRSATVCLTKSPTSAQRAANCIAGRPFFATRAIGADGVTRWWARLRQQSVVSPAG